jgi:hypothetical protein
MTNNQLHGKKFEDLIKGCGLFPGASDQSRSSTVGIDIEAKFDRSHGLPTSIKTTGSSIVTLSDARRFWAIDYPFRMLVGTYRQVSERKLFSIVHEFLILPTDLEILRGSVTAEEVEALHVGISLAAFPSGQHQAARIWVQQEKIGLLGRETRVTLTPKIDSNTQRRMQCSIKLADLISVSEGGNRHIEHSASIGDLVLPFALLSSRRR